MDTINPLSGSSPGGEMEITTIDSIIDSTYDKVNGLMEASVFAIGIYNEEKKRIDFPGGKEKGVSLPFWSVSLNEEGYASYCFKNNIDVFISDHDREYKKYLPALPNAKVGENVASVIYLPLIYKGTPIGVITVQAFKKNAYTQYQVSVLKIISAYVAIAIENAEAYKKLNLLLHTLKETQAQLIQFEKMASLGQLTAGIAHEIKNPLNFITNFSELSRELVDDFLSAKSEDEKKEFAGYLKANLSKINEHGKRADSIVKNMLAHSRGKAGEKQVTDINQLCDEIFNLAYHGMRASVPDFNCEMKKEFDQALPKINIIPQDISRVLLNLFSNAFYAVKEKSNKEQQQGVLNYLPQVLLKTKFFNDSVSIAIRDNANGIPEDIREKIFEPFFTTKPTGQGTGLGLSISYDIVTKGHRGELKVESKPGEFTEFIIRLPVN